MRKASKRILFSMGDKDVIKKEGLKVIRRMYGGKVNEPLGLLRLIYNRLIDRFNLIIFPGISSIRKELQKV